MGNCCAKQPELSQSLDQLAFQEAYDIRVKQRDFSGKQIGIERVAFRVKSPIERRAEAVAVGQHFFNVYGVVLPNLDPKGQVHKECQDLYFFEHCEDTLLCCLFDGHGEKGQEVVQFCTRTMKLYFNKNFQVFKESPMEALDQMLQNCDDALRRRSSIEVTNSGTTAVVVFLTEEAAFVGSVGDSRGIMGTLAQQEHEGPSSATTNNPYVRKIEISRKLYPIQLTVDHKPNHEEELRRIVNSGGVVQQMTNDIGQPVGPFRVWCKNKNRPGIAMSRSLGDEIAKSVGVIPNPTVHEFPIYHGVDQFLVMCSDGVWDVMSNTEVVNFVEKFRNKCMSQAQPGVSYPIRVITRQPHSTTIAHLLAEEARYRWLGICEDEDVMIDDISVLVVELAGGPEISIEDVPVVDRRTIRFNTLTSVPASSGNKRAVGTRDDIKRGSQLPAKDTSRRQDAKRGSLAVDGTEGPEETKEIEEIPFVAD